MLCAILSIMLFYNRDGAGIKVDKKPGKIWLPLGLLALLFAIYFGIIIINVVAKEVNKASVDTMRSIVQQEQETLLEAVASMKGKFVPDGGVRSEAIKKVLRIKQISYIDGRNEDGIVTFTLLSKIMEGSVTLKYIPNDVFELSETIQSLQLPLVSQTENTWRWEGLGMEGRGYIDVERLAEKWFYVETYWPT